MNASPARGKIKDPLTTVLFDLENLKEDIAYLLDEVESFKSLNKMADYFIAGIRKAQAEQAELYPTR
jgi:hypothetical protein